MSSRGVIAAILAASLVVGVVVVYSLRTTPPPITTTVTSTRVLEQTSTVTITGSNRTVTVSGGLSTTSVFEQAKVILSTGSQAVLCTETSYNVPDIVTSGSSTTGTHTIVSGNSTTVVIVGPQFTTYVKSSIVASATNSTNSAGYIVTSTSTDTNIFPSGAWTVMTCTYLP